MSWIGWLLLMGCLYLVIQLVRGIFVLVPWAYENYFPEARRRRRARQVTSVQAGSATRHSSVYKRIDPQAVLALEGKVKVGDESPPSRWVRLLHWFEVRFFRRTYDHWVASALSEKDPPLKIEYLTKALRLKPDYAPAWGLKGSALLEVKRYDEALACFSRSAELHPSALAEYKKGLCCYHLKRRDEALKCFEHALAACPKDDRQLRDDAQRMKSQVLADASPAGPGPQAS